jgi:hypothetical protein
VPSLTLTPADNGTVAIGLRELIIRFNHAVQRPTLTPAPVLTVRLLTRTGIGAAANSAANSRRQAIAFDDTAAVRIDQVADSSAVDGTATVVRIALLRSTIVGSPGSAFIVTTDDGYVSDTTGAAVQGLRRWVFTIAKPDGDRLLSIDGVSCTRAASVPLLCLCVR